MEFLPRLEQNPLTADPQGSLLDLHLREYPLRLDLFCFLSERCRMGTFQRRTSFGSLLAGNWPRYVFFRNTLTASRKLLCPSARNHHLSKGEYLARQCTEYSFKTL